MRSNVVALGLHEELWRSPIHLGAADARIQRAVVAWADQIGIDFGGCVLRLLEPAALVTEQSILYEWAGGVFAPRFAGSSVTVLHRSIGTRLTAEKPSLKPVARHHGIAEGAGVRTVRSLLLPFGPLVVIQFADVR